LKKKVKIQDFLGKTNYCLGTLSFSHWAILATWLDLGTSQKIQENLIYNPF
jgi:hypothetical protein